MGEFCMGTPSEAEEGVAMRGMIGKVLDKSMGQASDIKFSVSLWSESDEAQTEDVLQKFGKEVVLAPDQNVSAANGIVTGSIDVPETGTVVLRWNNYAGWVRAKLVSSY